jgi:hypothetical protein
VKNEWDLQAAVVAIAEADTGAGGIVELHSGNAHPVKEWGDPGLGHMRPVTAIHIQSGRNGGGTGNTRTGVLRLIAFVGRGAQGLESRILDRYEGTPQALGIISTPALAARGLDCRLMEPRRIDVSELTEEGGKALAIEWSYTFTRP